jgi:hypothetical protein
VLSVLFFWLETADIACIFTGMATGATTSSRRDHHLARWLNAGSTETRFFKVFFFQLISTMLLITVMHYILRPFGWKLLSELTHLTRGVDQLRVLRLR